MRSSKGAIEHVLYQSLSKVTKSYTLLIDTDNQILHHTQPLPAYVKITKTSSSLLDSLPTSLSSAIVYQLEQLTANNSNLESSTINFLNGQDIILASLIIERFSEESQQFLIHITETYRSLYRPFPVVETEKHLRHYQHEIATLRRGLIDTKETLEIVLRQFRTTSENMNEANEQFLELTTQLENRNKKLANREHFIHRITEISPGIIYVYDLVQQANSFSSESIGRVLGYSDKEVKAMGNLVLPTLILPEDLARTSAHHQALIEANDDNYRIVEYRMRSKSGRVRWYASYDKIFERNEANEPTKIIGIAQDITEQKKASLELEKVNAELKTFAYAASHDLKEPLNTVTMIVEMLQMELEDTKASTQELLGMLRASTGRMRSLITDLLEYALLGKEDAQYERLAVGEIVAEVLSDLDDAINRNEAKITKESLPSIAANPPQLKRLFQNLISNALKYRTPERSPIIHIGVEEEEQAWVFSIKDNGIGIAEEYQSKIFQVFQKLHSRDQYEGTGIGLASCQRIIENHKGEIWVRSESGKGATFYFSIPKNL